MNKSSGSSSGAKRVAAIAFAFAAAALSYEREAAAQAKPISGILRALGNADDGLSLVWGGIRGTWNTTSNAVSYVVVDRTGRALTYAVRRGTRPMVSFANSTATTFSQTGQVLTINFNRGLGAAQNIGVLTFNAAGEVTFQAINGVVDGVEYAYEQGAVIARNFASMRCDQVLTLAFGGDFPYSTSNIAGATADCARNVAVGFACSLPGTVYDLVESSTDWYRAVRRGMGEAPCNLVPIPPADAVCGALRASIRPAEALTRCFLKPQFRTGTTQLNGAVCRGIGDVAFGVVLDIATGGATTTSLAMKIARAVKAIYNTAGTVNTIESMVTQFCGPELAQLSMSIPGPATTYELWDNRDFTGARLAVNDHMATLGALEGRASAVRVPAGGAIAVFSGPNFQGACDTFQHEVGGFRYLNVGNDNASSARVGEYCPGIPRARLFANANLEGRSLEIATDLPELESSGFDGQASSISLAPGARLAVYSEPNYGGTCTEITSETRRLSDTRAGNDRISSVRLDQRCPRGSVTLYSDARMGGAATEIHSDVADMTVAGLNGTSSIFSPRIVLRAPTSAGVNNGGAYAPPVPLALYNQHNFRGTCLNVTSSLSQLPAGWDDQIRSIKFNAACVVGYQSVMAASALVSADGRCLSTPTRNAQAIAACEAACPSRSIPFSGRVRDAQCVGTCRRLPLVVRPCDGSPRQQWRALGPLLINGEDQWLSSPSATAAVAGTGLLVGPDMSLLEMNWALDNERIINLHGRCLEVQRGALWQDESHVRLSHCNGSVTERFTAVAVPAAPRFVAAPASAEVPAGELLACSMDVAVREGSLCRGRGESLVLALGTNRITNDANVLPRRGELLLSGSGASFPARDAHDPGSDSFSISLWFKLSSTEGTQTLLSNGAANARSLGYNLAMREGALTFRVIGLQRSESGAELTTTAVLSHAAPTPLAWHHFVAVIDRSANTIRASLDGSDQGFTLSGSLPAGSVVTSREALSVGAAGDETASQASIDALRLYPRPLVAADIASLASSRR